MSRLRAFVFTALVIGASPAEAAPRECAFDAEADAFVGAPDRQAACLLRAVAKWGHVSRSDRAVHEVFAARVGRPVDVTAEQLRSHVSALGLDEGAFGGPLDAPVSRANDGDEDAPLARYFVVHDTSTPNFGDAAFPSDIDTSAAVNDLERYVKRTAVAHLFIARTGGTRVGHDFGVPWRATKREKLIGDRAKGLFLHVELIQPRRRDPKGGAKNDAIAPSPGFTVAQYDALALAYVAASVRAKRWLVPALHAALDAGLAGAHDDPQGFDVDAWAERVAHHVAALARDEG